ncbi:hypothetical protein C8R45DRAFT_1091176 [Mycena sanguinolenta]|nr:hypothetical protein C8R45DRAFT_1091176 [Mycena sanguinolenta]
MALATCQPRRRRVCFLVSSSTVAAALHASTITAFLPRIASAEELKLKNHSILNSVVVCATLEVYSVTPTAFREGEDVEVKRAASLSFSSSQALSPFPVRSVHRTEPGSQLIMRCTLVVQICSLPHPLSANNRCERARAEDVLLCLIRRVAPLKTSTKSPSPGPSSGGGSVSITALHLHTMVPTPCSALGHLRIRKNPSSAPC